MTLLVFTLIIAVTALERAVEGINVTCSTTYLLFEVHTNRSLHCTVEEVTSDGNSSLQVSVVKINGGNCGKQAEDPIAEVTDSASDNQTKSIRVLFHNVTWQSVGNYSLKVDFGNITKERNFSVEIYDAPVLPNVSAIGYLAYFHNYANVFAFYAILPKRDKCAKSHPISYTANYRLQNCSLEGEHGQFRFKQVLDEDGKHMDTIWYAKNLQVCNKEKLKELKECKVGIDMVARHNFGISSAMSFVSKYIYTLVNLPVDRLKCYPTSKSVTVTWKSPCKVYSYWYTITYWDKSNNGTMHTKKPHTDEESMIYIIRDLRPATTYRVCVRAVNMQNHIISNRCYEGDVKTKEDIPSKQPEIIGLQLLDPRNGDIRWKVTIIWKLPERQFWNGKVFVVVEHSETRKPNEIEKSPRLTSNQTNYTISDLYFDRDYFARVQLCTKIGCRNSTWKFIGHKQSEKGSGKEWMWPVLTSVIVFCIAVFVIVLCVISRYRRGRRYGTLTEEPRPGTNGQGDIEIVNPRVIHPYEEPGSGTAPAFLEYDEMPLPNNADTESDLESDHQERLNAGQLQIHGNDLQDEDEIELFDRV